MNKFSHPPNNSGGCLKFLERQFVIFPKSFIIRSHTPESLAKQERQVVRLHVRKSDYWLKFRSAAIEFAYVTKMYYIQHICRRP